jgi:hypothetical protein
MLIFLIENIYLFISNFYWICDQKNKNSTTVQNFVHKKKAGMHPSDKCMSLGTTKHQHLVWKTWFESMLPKMEICPILIYHITIWLAT